MLKYSAELIEPTTMERMHEIMGLDIGDLVDSVVDKISNSEESMLTTHEIADVCGHFSLAFIYVMVAALLNGMPDNREFELPARIQGAINMQHQGLIRFMRETLELNPLNDPWAGEGESVN